MNEQHSASDGINTVFDSKRLSLSGKPEEQMSTIITSMIGLKQWLFFADGDEVSADKVAGSLQILPALMWQVEKMYRIAYGGVSTGVCFEPNELSVTGATVVLPEGRPRSPLLLFAQEALQRAQENYPMLGGASIDHMIQEFMDDRDAGLIPWVSQQATPQAGQAGQAGHAGTRSGTH